MRNETAVPDLNLELFFKSIEATSTGVLITDFLANDNPIVFANSMFCRLAGYQPEEVIGRNCRFLQGPDTDRNQVRRMREAIVAGKTFRGEVLNYRKDGTPFWNQLTISPIRNAQGQVTHFVGIQQDITLQKEAEKERDRMIAELTLVNEQLSQFSHMVAHDLRGPLGVIAGMLEFVVDNPRIKESQIVSELLERVIAKANSLSELTKDLLIYSQIGLEKETKNEVDLNEVLERALQKLEIQDENIVFVETQLPSLKCVAFRIEQLFLNLIGNALKHIPREEPCVILKWEKSGKLWKFLVKDNGPGIPQDLQAKLFEPRASAQSEVPGLGLGLAICHKIVEEHGGEMGLQSTSSAGSTFYFTLRE